MKVIENYLPESQIDDLINYHKNNFDSKIHEIHRKTEVIECTPNIRMFMDIAVNLNNLIKSINKNYMINYIKLVKWPCGEFQGKHLDFDYHPYTTIIYLNDDFEGGETIVGDETVTPKKNKLVGFNGNKIVHEVTKIKKGTRYTLACWYKNENAI